METNSTAVFRLSPHQKLIWQDQTADSPWNAVCVVDLPADVDERKLRDALNALTARHEILRTVYRLQPGMKVPFQMVLDSSEPAWNETGTAVDLSKGPLVRAILAGQTLTLTLPAIACDSRSLDILVRDLSAIYQGREASLPEEPLRYAQFAQWQLDLLESTEEGAAEARAFWEKQKTSGGVALSLPEAAGGDGGFQPDSVSLPLASTGADENTLLAAWQSLLWRLTGQTHFETRVWTHARDYEELESAVGAIGKFVPIPARFDGEFSFKDIVDHVRAAVAEASQWQEYLTPGEGSEDGNAAAFEYSQPSGLDGFHVRSKQVCGERFALKLCVFAGPDGLQLEFHYDSSRLEAATVRRWAAHYQTLLAAAMADPATAVGRLPLLTGAERHQLVEEWNRTEADYPRDRRLHELFEEQATRNAERLAVRAGEQTLTYRELNERANRVARHLTGLGVRRGSLVGLALNRGVDLIAGLLGILKAGAAYVPVNADNPKPRLLQQLAGAAALVTEAGVSPRIPEFGGPRVSMDADLVRWSAEGSTNPDVPGSSEDLIYVIFTSGSTGTPKGVGVRHRNLVNYAEFIRRMVNADAAPLNFATVSTLSADLGNTCVFPSLISGGCLHLVAQETSSDSAGMAAYGRAYPVDVLKIVPSHLEALLGTAEGAGALPRKILFTGGEGLTGRLVARIRELAPELRVVNHYGPTETTVGSLTFPLPETIGEPIPIGRPIANTRVYILDSAGQPAPVGVAGELYIAGDGVTSGYLGQPELTEERFPEDPFRPGKMYRTGDVARYRADGNVQFLGRADDQVKIRGFRIEPGEIEAAIRKYSGVKQAAVIARRDTRGEMRLIGYVVADPAKPVTTTALRDYLKEQLPDYMVPAALVTLPKLPLTANGKIDRQNLPEPEQVHAKAFVAPRNDTETAVAGIWTEVFRRGEIGVDDDFFEIGGHSLTATQVISRVREQFRVTLDMRTVFERPTIEGMAVAIEAARRAPEKTEPAIVAVSRDRYRRK